MFFRVDRERFAEYHERTNRRRRRGEDSERSVRFAN